MTGPVPAEICWLELPAMTLAFRSCRAISKTVDPGTLFVANRAESLGHRKASLALKGRARLCLTSPFALTIWCNSSNFWARASVSSYTGKRLWGLDCELTRSLQCLYLAQVSQCGEIKRLRWDSRDRWFLLQAKFTVTSFSGQKLSILQLGICTCSCPICGKCIREQFIQPREAE